MKLFLVMAFGLILLIPQSVFSFELDDFTISGKNLKKNFDSEIYLKFDSNTLQSGHITISDNGNDSKIVLNDPKIKIKKYGFLIIDADKNFIFAKEKKNDNYILLSKIIFNDSKNTMIFNAEKTNQSSPDKPASRDFLAEQTKQSSDAEPKEVSTESFKEKQLREKKEKLEKDLLELQQNLINNSNSPQLDAHTQALLDQVNAQSNQTSGKQLREKLKNPGNSGTTQSTQNQNDDVLKILIQIPHSIEYKKEFKLSGYVVDPKINKHDNYSFRDGRISDVSISGKIFDADDMVIHSFNEITSNNGYFATTYYVPDNSVLGEYKITIDAEKEIDNETATYNLEDTFFVTYIDSGTNLRPIAIVNPDQIVYHNFVDGAPEPLTLDGAGSYDPEGRGLLYEWTLVESSSDAVTQDDISIRPEGVAKVTIQGVQNTDISVFQLIVNDGSRDSLANMTKITAINDTLEINSIRLATSDLELTGFVDNLKPTITNENVETGIGYNLHITDTEMNPKINSGKVDFTATVGDQKYDITNSNIEMGDYDRDSDGSGNNVTITGGILKSFSFESGKTDMYTLSNGTTVSFDMIDGTAFHIHSMGDNVIHGFVNANAMNVTGSTFELSNVVIDSGTFINGFFDFVGSGGTFVKVEPVEP